MYIIKSDGTQEAFDTDKLRKSLLHAGAGEKMTAEIIAHVEGELHDGSTTRDIYHHAFDLLRAQEQPVALKYSLKRAVMDLGPSGFPFEKFVAEIFRERGYTAETGKIVRGFCVEHEIDVVAWNDTKLIMVEAKFHNDPGMKSDLKVALYVKARAEDLMKMTYDYGTQADAGSSEKKSKRILDEFWLVTNTKFSSAAIEYGSCQAGLHMVSWNYPPGGRRASTGTPGDRLIFENLHDLILEAKLHPLTCLTTIDGHAKKALLDQGIVLCKSLIGNPAALMLAGVKEEDLAKVYAEIEML